MSTPEVTRPTPDITPRMRPFYEAAAKHRLVIQRCKRCGTFRFPATEICSTCLKADMEWVDANGTGEVFSFVIMHQIYHPWFAERAPYVVAQIKLDEGPCILSTVIDVEPKDLSIGIPVNVDFQTCNDQVTLPVFRAKSST